MAPRSLSVLVPVFNEEATLDALLSAVEAEADVVTEIIIVDDCSTDGTAEVLARRSPRIPTRIARHETNQGKGAAIKTGLGMATGDLLLIQDADLEYSPSDYKILIEPFEKSGVDVVYGSRSFGGHAAYSFWFVIGNRLVTLATNVLFNSYITDMETCFKVMPLDLWRSLGLRSRRFGVEPEVTAKLLRRGHRIYEVPISYNARSRTDGKKLTWVDGLKAVGVLLGVRVGLIPSEAPTGPGKA
jgi:glycosyltransferase involved in cell wall biosynthesis